MPWSPHMARIMVPQELGCQPSRYLSLSIVVRKSCSSKTVSKLFSSIWTSTTILSRPGPLSVTRPFLPAYFLAAGDPPSLRTCTRFPTCRWLLIAPPPLDRLAFDGLLLL